MSIPGGSRVGRRTFLKGATTASLVGLFGTSATGTAAASNVDTSNMTERHVDVSPGQEVSGIIDDVSSGELLVFPSGTYTWSSKAAVTVDNWGVRCQPDTVFDVPAGWGDGSRGLVLTTTEGGLADNFLLENLTFDSSGRAAPQLYLGVRSNAHVDGLEYRMNGPLSHQEHGDGIGAYVTDSDGLLVIDDYRQFNNGDLAGYGGGNARVGIYVGPNNDGTVQLRNPVLQGFPNNACYVSRQPGMVKIEGGLLMNNNVSAVRVAGGVEVHGTTVVIDTERYVDGPGRIEGSQHNTRGFWGDKRNAGYDGGLVSDCSVIIESYRRCTGLAVILENRWFDVENTQFLLNDALDAVRAENGRIDVSSCTFDAAVDGNVAGVGDVAGSSNYLNPDVEPGQVSVEDFDDYGFDWSRTHPETPGNSRDPEQPESGPDVDSLSLAEVETDGDDAAFDAAWRVSHDDGDLESVALTLTSDADGSTEDDASVAVSGDGDSGTTRLVAAGDDGSDERFTVELTVADSTGEEATATAATDETERPDDAHVIEVASEEETYWMGYSFTTTGEITKGDRASAGDSVTENDDGTWTVEGHVGGGGVDDYEFVGSIESWSAEEDSGAYTVTVDGEEATHLYGDRHVIEVASEEETYWMGYSFTTTGEISKRDRASAGDQVTENDDGTWTVKGHVGGGGVDDYEFVGSIESWSAEEDSSAYTVTVDGEEATDLYDDTHVIEVASEEETYWMGYSFTTTGEISKGDSASAGDSVTENGDGTWTVKGHVGGGGVDDYEFVGSIESWSAEEDSGAYTVTVDGEEATDLYEPSAHTIEVTSAEETYWMGYSFTTTGEITKGGRASAGDSVTKNGDGTWTVTGHVGGGGTDDYEFVGFIESWSAEDDRNAYTVTVDGDEATHLY